MCGVVVTNVRNPRPDACPDAEELAAFVDGRLAAAAREKMERHLAECTDCRELFAEVVRPIETEPDSGA
jgi:anti-sigma factor RsiW